MFDLMNTEDIMKITKTVNELVEHINKLETQIEALNAKVFEDDLDKSDIDEGFGRYESGNLGPS